MKIFDRMKGYNEVLTSESGKFYCNDGLVCRFEPSSYNESPDGIDAPQGHGHGMWHYDTAVRTMIVPDGVRGFCDEFFMGGAVTDIFILPDSLESIGNDSVDSIGCVFINCFLPEVVIPKNVRFIGKYCFGRSYIKKMVIRKTNQAPYLRQFKDSTIEKLYLPYGIVKETYEEKYGFYRNFHNHCDCEIIEY